MSQNTCKNLVGVSVLSLESKFFFLAHLKTDFTSNKKHVTRMFPSAFTVRCFVCSRRWGADSGYGEHKNML